MPEMNLADPELELIDPTPNIHLLFLQFDKVFFSTRLASRAVVRWSKRMYSCAGTCSYEGRGGLCDIALSEPLLKLRPRKDLVETLLHEMIHAFLFVTNRDQDRDGHGPNFKAHMYRINQAAGINISIYHNFHDEVKLYQTHWWRCNGPCQTRGPRFGIVRKSYNKAPGPTDYWWSYHKSKCGGTFIKIKEPEKKTPAPKSTASKSNKGKANKNDTLKTNSDITKYIINTNTKINNNNTQLPKSPIQTVPVFTGKGHVIESKQILSDSRTVTEHVRNIWANKQIQTKAISNNISAVSKPNKHKADTKIPSPSPPTKISKIDDYFKANATLRDLYGDSYKLTKPHTSNKLVAVSAPPKTEKIDCPVCSAKIDQKLINQHLDECLNKDIIKSLTQDQPLQEVIANDDFKNKNRLNNTIADISEPISRVADGTTNANVDLININTRKDHGRRKTVSSLSNTNIDKLISLSKQKPNKGIENFLPTRAETERLMSAIAFAQINMKPDMDLFNNADIEFPPEPSTSDSEAVKIKPELGQPEPVPSTSSNIREPKQACPCCGIKFEKSVEDHFDECLAFLNNDDTVPNEGASTSNISDVIVIDDENDEFDETLTLNPTGTKTPCPCCMKLVEQDAMNEHLDTCLGLWDA